MNERQSKADASSEMLARWQSYANDVRIRASGQWYALIRDLAPNMEAAVAAKGKGVPCFGHPNSKDGLRILQNRFAELGGCVCNTCGQRKNGFSTLMWANSWDYGTAVREVGAQLGYPWDPKAKRVEPTRAAVIQAYKPENPEEELAKAKRRFEKINECYLGTQPIDWKGDNPVTRYYKNRGLGAILDNPPEDTRFHPGLDYWDSEPVMKDGKVVLKNGVPESKFVKVGTFCAIVHIIRTRTGEPCSLQRKYITEDGRKAPVGKDYRGVERPYAKEMPAVYSEHLNGSYIQLYPGTGTIITGEGVETLLAARLWHHLIEGQYLPVRAAISAGGLERLQLLDTDDRVYIYADHDDPSRNTRDKMNRGRGQEAAENLRVNYPEREIIIRMNPVMDEDWNDEYVRELERRTQLARSFVQGLKLTSRPKEPAPAPATAAVPPPVATDPESQETVELAS